MIRRKVNAPGILDKEQQFQTGRELNGVDQVAGAIGVGNDAAAGFVLDVEIAPLASGELVEQMLPRAVGGDRHGVAEDDGAGVRREVRVRVEILGELRRLRAHRVPVVAAVGVVLGVGEVGSAAVEMLERVERADVYVLGTPDYHGSISSAMKNFLDHFWKEFAGKLFATIVASHEKGLTVTDQLRTVARQCYAWSLPYGVSFAEREDLRDGKVASDSLKKRLEMFAHDIRVYGEVLAAQRRADLVGTDPGFMARHRKTTATK